jgi:adenosyl cobinamide kinase/adenosyl cobinamide phosphate guanylyltransferase
MAASLADRASAPVVMVATAEALDQEMAERIERHREERPPSWTTVEAPLALLQAIEGAPEHGTVIVDCLTLWVANMLAGNEHDDVEKSASEAAAVAASRPGLTIVVSNEVGMGIVPDNPLGRSYRDLLGRVNAVWAAAADRAYLLVAGRVIPLTSAETLLSEFAR